MKKQVTLFLMAFLSLALNLQAKTSETTLWESTYQSEIELNAATVATFKEGDVLRVYVTVPEGGANFNIVYKSSADNWQEHKIPSINNDWPWVNGGGTYKDIALTAADITALSGKNIYIKKGDYSTITKVSLKTVELDEQTLYNTATEMVDYTTINEGTLTPDMFEKVKEGDKIVVNASESNGGQVWIAKMTGSNWDEEKLLDGVSIIDNVSYTLTADDANIIKARGIRISGKNITLKSIGLIPASVKAIISSTGIGTFCSSKVLNFTGTGVTPYYASDVAEGIVTLTSVEKTASNTGYILKGSEGVYAIPVIVEEVTAPTTNYLKATGDNSANVTASTDGSYHYIFAKKGDNTPAFYKLTADHELAAHKAYLETTEDITPSTQGAPLMFDFSNGTTAIMDVFQDEMKQQPVQEDGVYYTLQGTRVQNPTKGLYILNGKKIIVK